MGKNDDVAKGQNGELTSHAGYMGGARPRCNKLRKKSDLIAMSKGFRFRSVSGTMMGMVKKAPLLATLSVLVLPATVAAQP
jgi:hypothetical protein